MKRSVSILSTALFLAMSAYAQTTAVTSPEREFGFRLGADRKLAGWAQLAAYYQKLGRESNRIRYAEVGKTTEGRPFVVVTISSPENLAHLDELRNQQEKLADPRITTPAEAARLAANGKTILAITCNIHSPEIASSQTAAEFAWRLATEDTPRVREILQNTVILLVPSLNPDGQQMVVDWYKKYLDTPYEGSSPASLWHHYVGHDDNRDWYTFTQVESQLTAKNVLNKWLPQIVYDVHQQGAGAARLFVPPWVDPIDSNIDPILVQSMNALGTNVAKDLTAAGKTGVVIHGVYDLWSLARHYMLYHGGLRLLTESASVRIATPVTLAFDSLQPGRGYDPRVQTWANPEPWPGGEWHLRDIVDYQMIAFFSVASNAARYRQEYLGNFYKVFERSLERKTGPAAYVIPPDQRDPVAVARLVNLLRFGLVEVYQAKAPFSADGHEYAAGSYVVPLAQPFGSYAKTLLEIQHYPDLRIYPGGPPDPPYDVTTSTLPLLLGVNAVEVKTKISADLAKVDQASPPTGEVSGTSGATSYVIAGRNNEELLATLDLLGQGAKGYRLMDGGAIYLRADSISGEAVEQAAGRWHIRIGRVVTAPHGQALLLKPARIGLYQAYGQPMDEGWTRWIFEQNKIPFTTLHNADIKAGNLNARFDAIVIPDGAPGQILGSGGGRGGMDGGRMPPEYTGGIGEGGLKNLVDFAQAGGSLVFFNEASLVCVEHIPGCGQNVLEGVANKDFYGPGSLLAATLDTTSPIALGADPETPIFFEHSPAFHLPEGASAVATYTKANPLLSGWLLGGDKLKGAAALAEVPLGKGRAILFGFRPQYRAQSEVTYKLMLNSLLYSSATREGM
jgi:hypothetical protein